MINKLRKQSYKKTFPKNNKKSVKLRKKNYQKKRLKSEFSSIKNSHKK